MLAQQDVTMSLVTVLEFGNRHKSLSVASLVHVTFRYYIAGSRRGVPRYTHPACRITARSVPLLDTQ